MRTVKAPLEKKLDSEAEHYPLIFFDMQSSCAGGKSLKCNSQVDPELASVQHLLPII